MRYFIELSYNGKYYHGWQIQPNAISIQEVLENALSKLLNSNIKTTGAGRTDAGVHAKQLFAHFDYNNTVDISNLKNRLNAFIADDISIINIIEVSKNTHARFDATSRSYEYHIYLGRDPFLINFTWQLHNKKLDVQKMNEASTLLLNYTNFKCFSKSKTDVYTYNCNITKAKWILDGNSLVFHITANRFLRNMVRAIVGTLYDVGVGKMSITDFINVIESEDRTKAGISVPAKGLFLTKIGYPTSIYK